MAASSDSKQAPHETPGRRRPRPFLLYLILALMAVTAVSLLYARAMAGRARALDEEHEKKIAQITRAGQTKIQKVTRYLAAAAARDAGDALAAVGERNWDAAGKALGDARDIIGVLQDVALEPDQDTVATSRAALQRAQRAVGEAEQADAAKAIGELVGALGLLPHGERP